MNQQIIRFRLPVTVALLLTMGLAAVVIQRNVSDLRSFSKLTDQKEVIRATSSGSSTPFSTYEICEPLEVLQKAMIVNLDGYLELNSEDVEVLRLTDEDQGIRLVANEERQLVMYFSNPNSTNYVSGPEIIPPISEFWYEVDMGDVDATRYEVEIWLFKIQRQNRQDLIIRTKLTKPFTHSQYNVVSDLQPSAQVCSGSGAVGVASFDNEFSVKFSTAVIGKEPLGIERNYRIHIMYLFVVYGCAYFLMKIWQSKNVRV